MFDQKYRPILFFLFLTIITIVGYRLFEQSTYFASILAFAESHTWQFIVVLVLIKTLGIVWPPFSGGILTIAAIPIIGWELAFLADFIGSLIGPLLAYYLGYHYGERILDIFFDTAMIKRVQSFEIIPGKEFEAVFVLHTLFYSIGEVVSYAAGVLRIRLIPFWLGIFVSTLVYAPIFFLAENIFTGQNALVSVLILVAGFYIFYLVRDRYFQKKA